MNATIRWVNDKVFVTQSGSGHAVVVDGPPESGGTNLGPRPTEMILMGLGACTSIDVVDILKKSRQPIVDCVTQLTAERAETIPAVFTRIHVHFVVSGRGLKASAVARAVELSATKYCSATLMLSRGGVDITHDFEVLEVERS